MIDFAGVGLSAPTDKLDALLRAWWLHDRILFADHPGHLTAGLSHLPRPYPPRRDPPRLGTLHWPTAAARWGTFFHLVTGGQLARIREALSPASGSSHVNGPGTLTVGDGRRSVSTGMYLLPARPVSQRLRATGSTAGSAGSGDEPDAADLYLIELVDERYYWWAAGDQAAPDPTPATWQDLITALFAAVGVTPTFSGGIPSAYDPPNADRWRVGFEPIPVQIDAACRTVGTRVSRRLDGSVRVSRWEEAYAALNYEVYRTDADRATGGRVDNRDIYKAVPAAVSVVFNNDPTQVEVRTLAMYSIPNYGAVGRVGLVRADPVDVSAAWADEAGRDYYCWQLPDWEADYRGVVDWSPTGAEGHVEWRSVYTGPDAPTVTTHVRRPAPFDPNVYGGDRVAGDGTIQVCGSPIPFGTDCDPCTLTDDDVEVFIEINGLLLDPCDFEVTETEKCGGGGASEGSSSSSSGGGRRRAVKIRLKGKTETVQVGKGEPVLCSDCVIRDTLVYLCFENGRYIGKATVPQDCGSGSGSQSGVA